MSKELSLDIYDFYKKNIDRLNLTDKEKELIERPNYSMIRLYDPVKGSIYNLRYKKKDFITTNFINIQILEAVLIIPEYGYVDLDNYYIKKI